MRGDIGSNQLPNTIACVPRPIAPGGAMVLYALAATVVKRTGDRRENARAAGDGAGQCRKPGGIAILAAAVLQFWARPTFRPTCCARSWRSVSSAALPRLPICWI